jgi:hypothetical protein
MSDSISTRLYSRNAPAKCIQEVSTRPSLPLHLSAHIEYICIQYYHLKSLVRLRSRLYHVNPHMTNQFVGNKYSSIIHLISL